jgi:bifunctional UDP-N-acetylglucosamine pyrophosphorylase/glucosamine-1-phosphate N-acetyltransferase/UDP-N-acetylglucosamine pyrophosphorylase
MNLKALVLAAGKGKRMQSGEAGVPKVMREACGRPLLSYVLDALSFLPAGDIVLIVGYRKEAVLGAFPAYPFAVQEQQLGTGHAVLSARELLSGYSGSLLVCCGDMPLMRRATYETLVREHMRAGNACTLLSGVSEEVLPYGRILRDDAGNFAAIVEERDCTPEQKEIRELNAGVYVFEAQALFHVLGLLRADNAQEEYYLTDVPALLLKAGGKVGISSICTPPEMLGVNTPEQLRAVEAVLTGRTQGN